MSENEFTRLHLNHWTEIIGRFAGCDVTNQFLFINISTNEGCYRIPFLNDSAEVATIREGIDGLQVGSLIAVLRTDCGVLLRRLGESEERC